MGERWKDIPEYEGLYQASDLGRIRSLDRLSKSGARVKGRVIKPTANAQGYLNLKLCYGKQISFGVHRLVMLAFNGKSDMVCDHINGIVSDNRLCNLEYVTHRENILRGRSCEKKESKTSKYRGICFNKRDKRYIAQFNTNGKRVHIGSFQKEIDAHIAYKKYISGLHSKLLTEK